MRKLYPKKYSYRAYVRRQRLKAICVWLLVWTLLFVVLSLVTACKVGPTKSEARPIENFAPLPWGNPSWDRALTDGLITQLPKLDKGSKDMERFCPRYNSLSDLGRVQAWAALAVAIAKKESDYDPSTAYKEKTGQWSLGLYQLSYGDRFCPSSRSEGDLKNPIVNIQCAVKIMGYWVEKDRVVAAGGYTQYGAPPDKGLAQYWAVIRVPDRKSRHHLQFIIDETKKSPGCA